MSMEQRELRGNIRTILTERGLKYRHLAEALEMPTPHVNNRMGAQWWARDEVQAVADFLEVSFDELLGNSLFKGDPEIQRRQEARRAETRATRAAEAEEAAERLKNSVPALCCECGAMRKVGRNAGLALHDSGDIRGRMTKELRCEPCGTMTTHALLRTGEFADHAEALMRRPTKEQTARRDLDKLIGHLRAFGVEVAEWTMSQRRTAYWTRSGGASALRVEFDESKSQWRFDLHPGVPALTLLPMLRRIWKCVALDGVDSEEWEDYDIRTGISYSPTDSNYARSIDELLEDVMRDENAIRRSIIDRALGDVDSESEGRSR